MKLKKESKIRVLENFYSLDYSLFGKPITEMDVCCPVFLEEYMAVKGALMSLVIEMYKLMKHSPVEISEQVNTKTLMRKAKNSARIARENCQKLVTSEQGRQNVKENLRESLSKIKGKEINIEKLVQDKIRTKAYSLAIDNLIVGRAITESKKFDKLNTWNGRILEDAYKILRDNLVECAINILENSIIDESKAKAAVKIGKQVFKPWATGGGFSGLTKIDKALGAANQELGMAMRGMIKGKGGKYVKNTATAKKVAIDLKNKIAALEKYRTGRNIAALGGTAGVAGTAGLVYGQKT